LQDKVVALMEQSDSLPQPDVNGAVCSTNQFTWKKLLSAD
jgi:hypothetical protein